METEFEVRTAAVVGLGLMGGSYAKRLTELGLRVIGIDRTEATETAALRDGAIAAAGPAHLAEAELVIFAVPEAATEAFVRTHAGVFRRGAVLTDAAGVKRGGAARIEALLPEDVDFVSAHPMAGREGAGYGQSSAAIFRGANYILVPSARNRPSSLRLVRRLAEALGAAHIEETTPEAHDRMLAYTSGLPHAAAAAVMESASFRREARYFIAGGFRDVTRIADINGALWADLFLENRENMLRELARYEEALSRLRRALAAEDREALRDFLDSAGRRKRSLADGQHTCGTGKGFVRHHDREGADGPHGAARAAGAPAGGEARGHHG